LGTEKKTFRQEIFFLQKNLYEFLKWNRYFKKHNLLYSF